MGEAGTPPSLNRYLYAYSNPSVYVDWHGYAAMASGGELDNYFTPLGTGAPDKTRLKFARKFAKARGIEGDKSRTLSELYSEFESLNITRGGDRSLRGVLLVEEGDSNITLMKYLLTQLGGYFSDEWETNPDLKQALHNRVSGLEAGDVVDVSDFWGFSALSADDQAAQNSAIYADYRKHGGYVPIFSSWVAGYARDIEGSFDEKAPPRLQYSSRVNLGASAAMDAALFYEGGSLALRGVKGLAATGRFASKGFTGTAGVKNYFRKLWSGEIGGRLNIRNYGAEGFGSNFANIVYRGAGNVAKSVPRGFSDIEQFRQVGNELIDALREAGLAYTQVGVRGSSVTGVSSKGGGFRYTATGSKKPSDIDVFIEFADDVRLTTSKKIPGFIHPDRIIKKHPALRAWSEKWSRILGREISPGGFKPGTFMDPNTVSF